MEAVYNEQFQKCVTERDEYLAGWQRAKADFINYKKEELKHLEDVSRYGSAELMRDLIAVLDNFDLALLDARERRACRKGYLSYSYAD